MKVYEALEHIKKNGPKEPLFGICHNLDCVPNFDFRTEAKWFRFQEEAFQSWKHFSGDKLFPVEGDRQKYWDKRHSRWDPKSKYGRLGRQLLNHLITWFKEKDI